MQLGIKLNVCGWNRVTKVTFINKQKCAINTLKEGATNLGPSLLTDWSWFHWFGANAIRTIITQFHEKNNNKKPQHLSVWHPQFSHFVVCKIWKQHKSLTVGFLICAWKCFLPLTSNRYGYWKCKDLKTHEEAVMEKRNPVTMKSVVENT